MTDYGVQSTGYVRKPLSVILAEIEAALITEFGEGLVQTAQSPMGQINGVMADLIAELDERNLDVYQSYDPDQAEGTRLDTLGRLRQVNRGGRDDGAYRLAITNESQARVDIQDVVSALYGINGVTYARMFVNDIGSVVVDNAAYGTVAVAVLGGDDDAIGALLRDYIVPGITLYGNTRIETSVDGYCRTINIVRPIDVPVSLEIALKIVGDKYGCPGPSTVSVQEALVNAWPERRVNGENVTFYLIRNILEVAFPTLEVSYFRGSRDSESYGSSNEEVTIGFVEIASLSSNNVTVFYDD